MELKRRQDEETAAATDPARINPIIQQIQRMGNGKKPDPAAAEVEDEFERPF